MKHKIVFAGCGEFVTQLINTVKDSFNVGVILSKAMSDENVNQMKKICKNHNFSCQFGFKNVSADIIITTNYPLLIKPAVVRNHLLVNTHFALLPRFRGFHPIQCALINDDKETGYTMHRVDEGMDSGPIYFQHKTAISDTDTIHTLNKKLMEHHRNHFPDYIQQILNGKESISQDESKAIYAGKRKPEDGLIDWKDTSRNIFNLVRAVLPPYYPGAYTFWQGQKVILTKVTEHKTGPYRHIPGQLLNINPKQGFLVKTGDTALWISEIMTEDGKTGKPQELLPKKICHRFQSE